METGKRFRYSRSSPYESLAPRSYRSGKKCWGVCVPDRGIPVVDADVGVGVDGARNGVLRRQYVRRAWSWKDQLARKKRSDEECDGMRAPAWRRDGGVQHVLLP
jgi:hypothetical protein